MITLLALAIAPIIYTEDVQVGHDLDVNTGWYVCQGNAPSAAAALLEIKNLRARRARALQLGCRYHGSMVESSPYRITRISARICLDRTPGWQLTQRGREKTTLCGREAHVVQATRRGITIQALMLSLDQDYE